MSTEVVTASGDRLVFSDGKITATRSNGDLIVDRPAYGFEQQLAKRIAELEAQVEAVRVEEREACAKIVDGFKGTLWTDEEWRHANRIACAIRSSSWNMADIGVGGKV